MLPYFPFGQQFNDKMGTVPLSPNDRLIEIDAHYPNEIALKRQLLTDFPDYYFRALPGFETAQWEVLALVASNLVQFSPESFVLRADGDQWHWQNRLLHEETVFTFGNSQTLPCAPLDWIGRQVQEDLTILAGPDAALVAGQLCFGNGWCLDEKLGLPFGQIHAPITPIVPPMMQAAQKFMERLPVGRPVWRANWSVKVTDQLDMTSRHTPALDQLLNDRSVGMTVDTIGEQLYLRVERQTLTRLPRSGVILFGIHTYQNRLAREVNERADAATRLINVFSTTPPAMIAYKGMTSFLSTLIDYLNKAQLTNYKSTT